MTVAGGRLSLTAVLLISPLVMAIGIGLFLMVGDVSISWATIGSAFTEYDPSSVDQVIVRDWRLPRALANLLVGAALAIAGAIMQAMTRNPLASPGIMGLNTGASFATVLGLVFLPSLGRPGLMGISMLGAATGAALVFGLGALSRGGLTPVRLALTGVAVSTLIGAFGSGVMVYFELGQDLSLWNARGTANVQWEDVFLFLPVFLLGLLGAIVLSPSLTVMSLGESVARGLGQRIHWAKFAGSVVVLLLAGGGVAIAGPVGFVGLMTPHMVRQLVGHDQRKVLPTAAVLGGLFLLLSDIGARLATTPYRAEVPVGVVTSLVGVPFFLYLACRPQSKVMEAGQ